MRSAWWTALSFLAALGCARGSAPEERDCQSCRADGESCDFTINCAPGSICNDAAEDGFDARKPSGVCLRVACSGDADCDAPELCTLERICRAPVCQLDGDCSGDAACIAGACRARPPALHASRCAIMTPDQSLETGGTVELSALAFDPAGRAIPLAAFDWSSDHPSIASVTGATLTAGAAEGSATITAIVHDRPEIRCTGLTITTFGAPRAGLTRVVAVDERTGRPLADAEVTIFAGGISTGSLDATGRAEWTITSTIESVTVVKPGWRSISVLSPGTRDLFLSVAPQEDFTRAGGIRGSVNLSRPHHADIQAAVVYGARSPDLLDYKPVPAADVVPTELDAPELGLDHQVSDMPGNLVLGLGNKAFTGDAMRCRGDAVPGGANGCFLTRMREGRGAAWAMGGQIKLAQATSLASEMISFETPGAFTTKDRARLIMFLAPLMQSLWFGAAPFLEVETFPKVRRDASSGADCGDPATALSNACRADFDRYARVDLEVVAAPLIDARVKAPPLPRLPNGRCAGGLVISEYAVLPGRGLVLLGLATASSDPQTQACTLIAVPRPFGDFSDALRPGEVPLRAAPLHSGMEGSKRVLVLAALDVEPGETRPRDLSLVADGVERLETARDLSSRRFLPSVQGRLTRTAATFAVAHATATASSAPVSARRLAIESARGSWIVFAPAAMESIALPDVAVPRGVLAESRSGTAQAFELDGEYSVLWSLRSAARIDRSIEHLRAVVTTQCSATGACAIE